MSALNRLWRKWVELISGQPRRRTTRSVQSIDLESRQLLAAAIAATPSTIPSYDGTGNNVKHSTWGSAGSAFLRIAEAAYADGISAPSGADRPNPRDISNALMSQLEATESATGMSNFVYAWGQFIDHDIDLTDTATPEEKFNISVPTGDDYFDPAGTGTKTISLSRSNWDPATGTGTTNPRQQVNSITAYIDGSMVYGSSQATAESLRTFVGGKLKTSEGNLLPVEDSMFVAGDIRASENPELMSLQTLFMREHNRLAEEIGQSDPSLTDEQIYQKARQRVVAEIQAITYNEFLPALLGPNALKRYSGYKPNVNVGISNEFATAAFRVGHTMVGNDTDFLDDQGNPVRDPVLLKDAFFNISILQETGIDPVLKYLASDRAEEIDTQIVDSLQNFLFGAPGQGGLDLASLNIQRGRDHGLADYNTTRAAFGLPKVTSFAQITSNPELQQKLEELYGDVNKIDLWVGGLAEDHVKGGNVGETFARIIADQFTRLRDGDRFYYQNAFKGAELREIQNTKLSDILKRNTDLENLQDNVFFFQTSIEGRVFGDRNRDGNLGSAERALGGRTVELLDSAGDVVMTTTSKPNGTFRFEGMPLGTYSVREVLPAGTTSTTVSTPIVINKGMEVKGVLLGEAPRERPNRDTQVSAQSRIVIQGSLLDDSLLK